MRPLVGLFFCTLLFMVFAAEYPKGGAGYNENGIPIKDGSRKWGKGRMYWKVKTCCTGCSCKSVGDADCCKKDGGVKCACCEDKANPCKGASMPWPPEEKKESGQSTALYDGYNDNQYITLNITFTTMCIMAVIITFIIGSFIWNVYQCINMNKYIQK